MKTNNSLNKFIVNKYIAGQAYLRKSLPYYICPVFDGHMHIQSTSCAPLQIQIGILAERKPFRIALAKRRFYDMVSKFRILFGRMGRIATNSTDIIGIIYMEFMKFANLDLFLSSFESMTDIHMIPIEDGENNGHHVHQLSDFKDLIKYFFYYEEEGEYSNAKLIQAINKNNENKMKRAFERSSEQELVDKVTKLMINKNIELQNDISFHEEMKLLLSSVLDFVNTTRKVENRVFNLYSRYYYNKFIIKEEDVKPVIPKYMHIALTIDFMYAHYWGRYGIPLYFVVPSKNANKPKMYSSINNYLALKIKGNMPDESKLNSENNVHDLVSQGSRVYRLKIKRSIPNPKTIEGDRIHLFPDFDFYNAAGCDDSLNNFIEFSAGVPRGKYVHLINKVPSQKKKGKTEYELYENFKTQLDSTKYITMNHPFEFFPFYFFEPRRYVDKPKVKESELIKKHAFFSYKLRDIGPGEKSSYQGLPLANKLVLREIKNINWSEIIKMNHKVISDYKENIFSSPSSNDGIYWGYKMYTRYGFRPDDYFEPIKRKGFSWSEDQNLFNNDKPPAYFEGPQYYPHLYDFYAYCMKNTIPIVCHCNAGGSIYNDVYNLERFDWNRKWGNHGSVLEGFDIKYDKRNSINWLDHHYVAPHNWERVLNCFPTLKINLAHFGGGDKFETFTEAYEKEAKNLFIGWKHKICELISRYENVYTDLACWEFSDLRFFTNDTKKSNEKLENIGITARILADLINDFPDLRSRIMVGSDWYLMERYSTKLIHEKGTSQMRLWLFVLLRETTRYLDEDKRFDVWYQFSVINPLKFLGLVDESKQSNDTLIIKPEIINKYKDKMSKAIQKSDMEDNEKERCLKQLEFRSEMFKRKIKLYNVDELKNEEGIFRILENGCYEEKNIHIPEISQNDYIAFFEKTVRDNYLVKLVEHEYLGTCDSYKKGEWKAEGRKDYIDLIKDYLKRRGIDASNVQKNQQKPKTLFITCDDYGANADIDAGIEEAIKSGNISSVAIFANVEGIKERAKNLYKLGKQYNPNFEIGIHLTISSGYPVSDGDNDKFAFIFCDTKKKKKNGKWPFKSYKHIDHKYMDQTITLQILKKQLQAQMNVFLKNENGEMDDEMEGFTFITCHHEALKYSKKMFTIMLEIARENNKAIRSPIVLSKFNHNLFLVRVKGAQGNPEELDKMYNETKAVDNEINELDEYFWSSGSSVRSEILEMRNELNSIRESLIKSPDCVHMGHYGPVTLLISEIHKPEYFFRLVNKKKHKLVKIVESFLANDDYQSMEIILHLGRMPKAKPNFPISPKKSIADFDYPGLDKRYFQGRVVELESIKAVNFNNSDYFKNNLLNWGKWSEL